MTDDSLNEVRARVERSVFHRWAGMRLDRIAPGEVDVSLEVEPHHMNLVGIVHGGVIATLADTATGIAMKAALPRGLTHVTAQLNVNYLSPGRGGRLIGRGRVVRVGARVGYAEADILDWEDKLLARATATFTVMKEPSEPAD